MNYIKSAIQVVLTAFSLVGCLHNAFAAVTLFGTRADFLAGLGGAPTVEQNFEGFAEGANLLGEQVLPSVTMSTNLANLSVFNSLSIGKVAFATTRDKPEAEYTFNFAGGYKSFGFEINAYDPSTPGPGFLSFYFANGDTTYTLIPVLPPATESTALFFGVISDTNITKITWLEGPETSFSCCEETVIDNLIAGSISPVPEPGVVTMMLFGLACVAGISRQRLVRERRAQIQV
jgi:PEP-CTERM motif